jgi:predicted acyltransferase
MSEEMTQQPARRARVESIDAFRGFTIFSMIFVIMVAGYRNLPLTFPHFGSAPVSTFKHASEDNHPRDWAFYEGVTTSTTYRQARILARDGKRYDVAVVGDDGTTASEHSGVSVRHARPLKPGEPAIAVGTGSDLRFMGVGNGCTFTDLVAPFFVFIVGLCIPLSRGRRGSEWWWHVGVRTVMLILAGVVYISLILKLSYWWGILQAIGVSFFMGAACMFLGVWGRWAAVLLLSAFHAVMTWNFPWWTTLGDPSRPFFTIANLQGDMLRPLTVHCTPWASISYGVITIMGTLLGDAVVTREPGRIIRQSLLLGVFFTVLGYVLHVYQAPMNKDIVSPSYALFTGGLGALSFLVFYVIIDVWKIRGWDYVFREFGANALLAYFLQPVVRIFFVALGLYPFFTGHSGWAGMAWGLLWTMGLWSITVWCNRRNIYWKL